MKHQEQPPFCSAGMLELDRVSHLIQPQFPQVEEQEQAPLLGYNRAHSKHLQKSTKSIKGLQQVHLGPKIKNMAFRERDNLVWNVNSAT